MPMLCLKNEKLKSELIIGIDGEYSDKRNKEIIHTLARDNIGEYRPCYSD
jgi:hypothetical protein